MKLIGLLNGTYNDRQYYKAFFVEPITQNGYGNRVCSARQSNGFSCSVEAYNQLIQYIDCEVTPSFDQYGRIIGIVPSVSAY